MRNIANHWIISSYLYHYANRYHFDIKDSLYACQRICRPFLNNYFYITIGIIPKKASELSRGPWNIADLDSLELVVWRWHGHGNDSESFILDDHFNLNVKHGDHPDIIYTEFTSDAKQHKFISSMFDLIMGNINIGNFLKVCE